MERLTSPSLKDNFKHCVDAWSDDLLRAEYWRLYDALAAYEDTGLPPETCAEYKKFEDELVRNGMTFQQALDLLEARHV